jgi:hypothetical protein
LNAYAIFAVTDHLESLRADAAKRRMTQNGPTVRDRIAAAAESFKAVITSAASPDTILPTLNEYPYRS